MSNLATVATEDVQHTTRRKTSTTSSIRLSKDHLGLGRIADNPLGTLEVAETLLQENHINNHIFWRDVGGHNHVPHSVLTVLALGGGPDEIRRAYDDGISIQRVIPTLDESYVQRFQSLEAFRSCIGDPSHYNNYLIFFERQIAIKGWREVLQEYVFDGTSLSNTIFAQLYEGAHHPMIHLGFGVEFELPSIIAEGLAQAVVHDSAGLEDFFAECESNANSTKSTQKYPLLDLYKEIRANLKLRYAARLPDGPVRVRDGVLGRARKEIISIASKFRIQKSHDSLMRACAEMINLAAYSAGGAQRIDKARRIDFFHMHNVNASIFFTCLLQQDWISLENKIRLVERKARTDLLWYAASAAAELRLGYVEDYKPTHSKGLDWNGLYAAVNTAHDDGHVAKFIRAIKNGEEACRPYETGVGAPDFPIKAIAWFRLAQMAYDTTLEEEPDDKWIWGSGFDPLWFRIPALPASEFSLACAAVGSAEVQRATLDRFIDGWATLSTENMIGTFANDFVQTTLPHSLGVPSRTREQVQAMLPLVHQTMKNHRLNVHEIIHDATQGKAVIHASLMSQTSIGDHNNEHAIFVTFSEDGERISNIKEMFDTNFVLDYFPKLLAHLHETYAP